MHVDSFSDEEMQFVENLGCSRLYRILLPPAILQAFWTSSRYSFTEPPLSTQIDWEASSCQAELILNGDYDSTELDDLTELLLNQK
jgi:hypothetical protein